MIHATRRTDRSLWIEACPASAARAEFQITLPISYLGLQICYLQFEANAFGLEGYAVIGDLE